MHNRLLFLSFLLLALITIIASGCARFNQWQLNTTHDWQMADTKDVIYDAIPQNAKDWKEHGCEFLFNAPTPPTVKFKNASEMAAALTERNPDKVIEPDTVPNGVYFPDTHEVYYRDQGFAFNDGSTLVHEYAHYMYEISNLEQDSNKYCRKQAFAYLVQYAWEKSMASERWEKAYKRERSKNLSNP